MSKTSGEEVAARLQQMRTDNKLSQQDIATRMIAAGHKWSQAAVWNTENGSRKLTFVEAVDLAGILNVTLADIAGITEAPRVDVAVGLKRAIAILEQELAEAQ